MSFPPSNIGLQVIPHLGLVYSVEDGSLAQHAQVRENWYISKINGVPYTYEDFRSVQNGFYGFEITFTIVKNIPSHASF